MRDVPRSKRYRRALARVADAPRSDSHCLTLDASRWNWERVPSVGVRRCSSAHSLNEHSCTRQRLASLSDDSTREHRSLRQQSSRYHKERR